MNKLTWEKDFLHTINIFLEIVVAFNEEVFNVRGKEIKERYVMNIIYS